MAVTNLTRYHAFVEGRVQGVGFRMFVLQHAEQYGLTGWVRNTWQDEVEVLAEGPQNSIQRLADDLHQGPPSSFVTSVREEMQPYLGEFARFAVMNTV
jgi:acylphosphatase